jgi:choline dehydrogenase-like flavoprotein
VRTGASWRGVRLAPYTRGDLAGRRGYPASTWPIDFAELERYIASAQDFFGLPSHGFGAGEWKLDGQDVLVDPDIESRVFQFGDGGRLVEQARRDIAVSERITLLSFVTALEILVDPESGLAIGVRAVSLDGREVVVNSQAVVVAGGAIASTQLLLASDSVIPGGLGNHSDQLGRHFMDHPLLDGGELVPESPADFRKRSFYDLKVRDGVPVMGHLRVSDTAIERDGLLDLSLLAYPREAGFQSHMTLSRRQRDGFRAALAIRDAAVRRRLPEMRTVVTAMKGADGVIKRGVDSVLHPKSSVGRGGWSDTRRPETRFASFEVIHQAEQAPHPDNRITLSDERNELGQRRTKIDWQWHAEDIEKTKRSQELYRKVLKAVGWGDFRIARTENDEPVVKNYSSNHFMGTTRMSAAPEDGVVDADLAVHGTRNVYVASSSVFPTGGFANVTLTAVALGIRAAEHIAAVLAPVTMI